jgi:hypothetical protein
MEQTITATKIANPSIQAKGLSWSSAVPTSIAIDTIAATIKIFNVKSFKASYNNTQKPLGGIIGFMLLLNRAFLSSQSSIYPGASLVSPGRQFKPSLKLLKSYYSNHSGPPCSSSLSTSSQKFLSYPNEAISISSAFVTLNFPL